MTDKVWCVIGRGMVGSVFAPSGDYNLYSHKEWEKVKVAQICRRTDPDYGGFICSAGIAGSEKCDTHSMSEVMDANVGLPAQMLDVARICNVPVVVFSTTSVYKYRGGDRLESDEIHPHNRYVASKISMEYALQSGGSIHAIPYSKCFILRIPFVIYTKGHYSFEKRCSKWKVCEDVVMPVIYPEDLAKAVDRIASGKIVGGIYNLASENVHLPTFIKKQFGWRGDVVKESSLQLNPLPHVNLDKAKKAGLI